MASPSTRTRSVEPRGRGRPSLLTTETTKTLTTQLLNLASMEDACRIAGIHPGTGMAWMAKGRKQTRGEYRDFYEAVEDARTRAKALLVQPVMARGRVDPKMALEILARRFPNEWARTHKLEVDDKSSATKKREGVRERVVANLEKIERRLSGTPDAAALPSGRAVAPVSKP